MSCCPVLPKVQLAVKLLSVPKLTNELLVIPAPSVDEDNIELPDTRKTPEVFMSPFTSKTCHGLVVPIPTLPLFLIYKLQ